MPPEDVLLTMAQLGVAIAGFNGVATAPDHGARTGQRRDVIGSVLITSAAAVIVWSVVPLVRTMQAFVLTTAALQLWNGIALGEAWPHVVAVAQSLGVSITAFFMLSHERDASES